jgi:hypothetical protein
MDMIERPQRSLVRHGRNYRRFTLEFPVRLKFETESKVSEIEAVSKNLSVGGLLVRSALPVPHDTYVTFVLSVHGSQSVRQIHLAGEGQVVRLESSESDGTFMMAVRCNEPVTQLEEYLPV